MKIGTSLLITLLSLPALTSADSIPDPGNWYRDDYAPLWAGQPTQHIEELLGFYAETVETHSAEGGVHRDNRRAWLAEPMAEWQAEGWLRSEMTGLQVDHLNPGTSRNRTEKKKNADEKNRH